MNLMHLDSMVVTMCTMNVAMFNFFLNGGANFQHIQLKTQSLPSPRVIAIQHHSVALDFDDIENGVTTIGCSAPQLTTDFDTGWKIFFGHGLHQAFVAVTK